LKSFYSILLLLEKPFDKNRFLFIAGSVLYTFYCTMVMMVNMYKTWHKVWL